MRELKEGREGDRRRLEQYEQRLQETADDHSLLRLGYERELRRASDEYQQLQEEVTRERRQKNYELEEAVRRRDAELNETRRLLDQALMANASRQPPSNLTHRDGGPAPPPLGGRGGRPLVMAE